jgi:hypothetical protein
MPITSHATCSPGAVAGEGSRSHRRERLLDPLRVEAGDKLRQQLPLGASDDTIGDVRHARILILRIDRTQASDDKPPIPEQARPLAPDRSTSALALK